VIAESDLNDPRLVRSRDAGGYGLDATWSDDFHHAIHAAFTGERNGYYVDFGGVEQIAKTLRDRFALDGRYSRYRRRRHGAPASDVPTDRIVAFVQNHDQVGNRAQGERLSALTTFEQRKLAAALLLLSPYVPVLFMGEEYGELHPFFYFVDHGDSELNQAVRRGREREFAAFGWSTPPPDPAAEDTFQRSRIDPAQAESSPHSELVRLYRDLIRQRRSEPLLRPGAAAGDVDYDGQAGWLVSRFHTAENDVVALFNCSGELAAASPGMRAGRWRRRIATDDAYYGGGGTRSPSQLAVAADQPARIELAGYSAALYAWEPD
jgi:maltooligosyltrehalose trehalohydrolase